MNLYSQGIDPELDFSDLNTIARQVSQFNQITVPPRHPYVGYLVFTAFSGSHQDAIKKCLSVAKAGEPWQVAYLPINPADVGRSYQEVIRVNSQSGKAGAAFWVEQALGLQLPCWLQSDFSLRVQQETEARGQEISAADLTALFQQTYLNRPAAYELLGFEVQQDQQHSVSARLRTATGEMVINGQGSGVLAAFVNALQTKFGWLIDITDYHEHALSAGKEANAVSYIRLHCNGVTQIGIACHQDIVSASLNAILTSLGGN
jgi:2-isopropylmalate synthase